jgi:uncharacterized protein (DUF2384 family)
MAMHSFTAYVHEPPNKAPSSEEILARARVMHGDGAAEWLETPLPILGGLAPADWLYSPIGRRKVMQLLDRVHSW